MTPRGGWRPEAPYSAKNLCFWLAVFPAALHLMIAVLFGLEADTSGEMLFAVIFAAGSTAWVLGAAGYGPSAAIGAAVWPPLLFSWRRWYWGMDMHSPGGAAQSLAGLLGWNPAPAPLAVAAIAATTALVCWGITRLNDFWRRRTGHPLIVVDSDDD